MYNIGFRAHDFGSFRSPLELGKAIDSVKKGAPLQLAPFKSFPSLERKVLTEEFALQAAENLNIRIIGSYFNPVHPNEEKRREGIERFKRFLDLSSYYGAYAVGTETGSLDPECGYHEGTSNPEVLDTFYRTLEELLEHAEKKGGRVAIEPVATNHTISSLERMENMIRRFDTPCLAIILDISNIAPLSGIKEKDGTSRPRPTEEAIISFIDDFTTIAGDRLSAAHVKNYELDSRGMKVCDLPADRGAIDWRIAAAHLESRYPSLPLLIEGPLLNRHEFFKSLNI